MSFAIPEIKSVKTLFVINKNSYTTKAGEIRASVQALVPAGTHGNKKGYAVAEYTTEPSVYDSLDFDSGPVMADFEVEPRESQNRFGGTTNSDHLLRVVTKPTGSSKS